MLAHYFPRGFAEVYCNHDFDAAAFMEVYAAPCATVAWDEEAALKAAAFDASAKEAEVAMKGIVGSSCFEVEVKRMKMKPLFLESYQPVCLPACLPGRISCLSSQPASRHHLLLAWTYPSTY